SETLVPRAASRDLSAQEDVPARLDPRERPGRDALHLHNGLAYFSKDTLLVRFRQGRPGIRAQHTRQPRDDEICPSVALAFGDDFGNRDAKVAAKLRERAAF